MQKIEITKESIFGAQNYAPLSVVLERGKGEFLWDVEGVKYLDMMSAYSAVSHGHSHPELIRIIKEQVEKLSVVSRAYYTKNLGDFLETLTKITKMDRALVTNTGAEAVETAIWLSEVAPKMNQRTKGIIKRLKKDRIGKVYLFLYKKKL